MTPIHNKSFSTDAITDHHVCKGLRKATSVSFQRVRSHRLQLQHTNPTQRGALQVAQGRKAKLRNETKESEVTGGDSTPKPASASAVPSLNSLQVQQDNHPPAPPASSALDGFPRILIWMTTLLAAISVFYSIVFFGGSGLMYLIKDNITFTRKDFVPYSERRRLEKEIFMKQLQEQEEAYQQRKMDGIPEEQGDEIDDNNTAQPFAPSPSATSPSQLLNLLPKPTAD